MTRFRTDRRRSDYKSPPGTENQPIERAMAMFVGWAVEQDRSYHSDIVKEELGKYLQAGLSPQQAVRSLVARAP